MHGLKKLKFCPTIPLYHCLSLLQQKWAKMEILIGEIIMKLYDSLSCEFDISRQKADKYFAILLVMEIQLHTSCLKVYQIG